MVDPWDFPYCQICGMRIFPRYWSFEDICPENWNPYRIQWVENAIALFGPHLVPEKAIDGIYQDSPDPKIFPGGPVSRHTATAEASYGNYCLRLLPSDQIVEMCTSEYAAVGTPTFYEFKNDEKDPEGKNWYLSVHDACDHIAKRVMQASSTFQIKSLTDLWVTLLRRREWEPHFLAYIPQRLADGRVKKTLDGYYAPVCFGEDPDGWWQRDPIHIPGLTESLMSNLQWVDGTETESSSFERRFLNLPPELRDHITSFLSSGSVALECNYIMPQSYWMQAFIRMSHLWDLDMSVIQDVLSSSNLEDREWNWEKLTRQVMAGPTPLAMCDESKHGLWEYKDVGLDVPDGLTNRRRIWQVLDDMDPEELVGRIESLSSEEEIDHEFDGEDFHLGALPTA